ncbi:hypothetical protein X798_00783 [Onchocerca flexuosa]|uniref:DUF7038 domain-containing protein n=1 Tax=Onchocerca flexuosa TaxID=387005 RepID=A0A238C467_9BILA|nr:hypothetical protein X798_00783 [Onchocerca flexuosa]
MQIIAITMYGIYYLGIVLEVADGRVKILRRTKIYQFNCEIPAKIFNDDSMIPVIEPCPPVLPTKIVKLHGNDGLTNSRISIQTVAAIPCRSSFDNNLEQYVWSPHFEWILDNDGIFNNVYVMPDVIYVTWIELLDEPFALNSNVLMKVAEIVRPAYDQLPKYDAPWAKSEMPVDSELLSVHCLQGRPKNKINPATLYSGLVIWRDMECKRKQIALWSIATGIVYFRHEQCKNIAIGAWLDFAYSKSQMVLTREVKGKAQICEKMKIPENLPTKDFIWMSDVVGKVWVNLEQFKKSMMVRWNELAGNTMRVWLSCFQFNSTVHWKFHSFVEPNEYVSLHYIRYIK